MGFLIVRIATGVPPKPKLRTHRSGEALGQPAPGLASGHRPLRQRRNGRRRGRGRQRLREWGLQPLRSVTLSLVFFSNAIDRRPLAPIIRIFWRCAML